MRDVVAGHHDRLSLMAGGALLSPYLQDMPPEDVTPEDSAQFRRIATQILRDGAAGFGEMIVVYQSNRIAATNPSWRHGRSSIGCLRPWPRN